ncbi:hypothetical protein VP496E541_P0154 [Vibrio phage 496E54-1]|nr:hypothetical protein VP496E541_P0154 [Vibrio phage 496E54-1]
MTKVRCYSSETGEEFVKHIVPIYINILLILHHSKTYNFLKSNYY